MRANEFQFIRVADEPSLKLNADETGKYWFIRAFINHDSPDLLREFNKWCKDKGYEFAILVYDTYSEFRLATDDTNKALFFHARWR